MAIGYKDYLPGCAQPPIQSAGQPSKLSIDCFMCGKSKPLQYGCTKRDYAYKMSVKGKLRYFCSHTCMEAARGKFKPAKKGHKYYEIIKPENQKF